MNRLVTHHSVASGKRLQLELGVMVAITPAISIVSFTEREEGTGAHRFLLAVRSMGVCSISGPFPAGAVINNGCKQITHTQTLFDEQGRILAIELSIL